MAKTALNKGALQRQREQLKLYQRVLPSLDLKRQQLTIEVNRARAELERIRADGERLNQRVAEELPMLANRDLAVSGLVELRSIRLGEENVVGVRLPLLASIEYNVRPYAMLAKPHWVDVLVERLKTVAEARLRVQVAHERVRVLERAARRITQRVNLFDKLLIPDARENIRRIQIFLGDQERSAIVRSKLAKAKRRHEQA